MSHIHHLNNTCMTCIIQVREYDIYVYIPGQGHMSHIHHLSPK
jgi:hypothetical protein